MSVYETVAQKRTTAPTAPSLIDRWSSLWPPAWALRRGVSMVTEFSAVLLTRLRSLARLDAEVVKQIQSVLPAAELVKRRVAAQHDRLSGTLPLLDRMHANVSHEGHVIEQAHHQTTEARVGFEDCLRIGKDRSQMIERLIETARRSASGLAELNRNVDEVEGLLNNIQDIGAQVNLLALNASIEAARSGVHGAGFAVVAREMRSLADRTSQSAGQILTMTGSIHRSTEETVSSIQEALLSTEQHPEIKHLMTEAIEACMSKLREVEASHTLLLSQSKSQLTSIESLQKEWTDLHASTDEFRQDAAEFHKHGERALVVAEELQRELHAFGSALRSDVDALAATPRAGVVR